MATFSIDNDRNTIVIDNVTYDQSAGVQTPFTTDTGNEVDVTLSGGVLGGLDSGFLNFLGGLTLTDDQKAFTANTDAASSSTTFIKVTADSGETLNDLKLLADSSTALTGITTLAGDSLYVHVDASGNYATLWTTSDDSGRIVGAVALTNETIDNVTTHTATAGVQMVFFEAISHPNTSSQDESVSLSDVLKVAVDSAVKFDFDQLDAGNFLWAAVGDGGTAMLITGQNLNVKDSGKPSAIGDIEKGGSDPSDAVNTSKATDTTIGINAQHFAPTNTGDGATGVFTFVTGYAPLEPAPGADPVFTGQNVKQIDYDDYINVSSASVFISQLTGGSTADIRFSFWEAGGGGTTGGDKVPSDLLPEEGYSAPNVTNPYSYIGNQDTNSNLTDDTAVAIASVTLGLFTWTLDPSSNGTSQGGITVTITGNNVVVDGAQANDLITFTALNDPSSTVDGTFNRIDIQALQGSAAFDIGHIDLASGGLTPADLGNHLFVDDDGPTLTAAPVDLSLANTDPISGTAPFGYDIGTDDFANAAYLAGATDFVDSDPVRDGVQIALTGAVSLTGAITNAHVDLASETTDSALFNYTFSYDGDPSTAGVQTTVETGTLTINKTADTWSFTADDPILTVSTTNTVVHTAELLGKQPTGNTGHPPIVVEKLAADDPTTPENENFFVQFTADAFTGGKNPTHFSFSTDGDHITNDTLFNGANHDLIGGAETWVSATQTTNGVAGDTIQQGENLTLRFFSHDILGDVASGTENVNPDAVVDGVAIKFDGIGASEDLIVTLDLIDPDNGQEITRAITVNNSDIFKTGQVPAAYSSEFTLDNNDGLLIIESNDYNVNASDNYQIQGVQIMQSANGLTGTGINLVGAVGSAGGSATNGTQSFTDPSFHTNDVLKITDIGFITTTTQTTTQDASLDFALNVADADKDLLGTQTLHVDIINM